MDISASQYNSASESGWTHYLDESSLSENYLQRRGGAVEYEGRGARVQEEEEEEDLSMLSDASSGPPHFHEPDDDERYCDNWYPSTSLYTKESEKKKKKVKEYGRNQRPSPLDDTASSPLLCFPEKKISFSGNGAVENALDFSEGLSATRTKRKPKFQRHSSFFESPLAGNQASKEPGGFDEEERK